MIVKTLHFVDIPEDRKIRISALFGHLLQCSLELLEISQPVRVADRIDDCIQKFRAVKNG
jgi:hypothetical protein